MSEPRSRLPVAVLGATGSVGQRLVQLLADHPWYRVVRLVASQASAGRPYRDAVDWVQDRDLPASIAEMRVEAVRPDPDVPLVFSALDSAVAGEVEEAYARAGAVVVSNARNHRMRANVPLVVPEVNADHLDLVRHQPYGRGAIVTNPNCSTIGLVLALHPLHRAIGVRSVKVVTLQAVSGAGLPGVSALKILGNVIPHIPGEEDKIERETRKILGVLGPEGVREADIAVSAQCTRVPVVDGHTACVSVKLARPATLTEVRRAWQEFSPEPRLAALPSAPRQPVRYVADDDGPQPRLHAARDRGMAIAVGRLRACPVLDYSFVAVSHNTLRGAAGGTLLCAEVLTARGLLEQLHLPGRPHDVPYEETDS